MDSITRMTQDEYDYFSQGIDNYTQGRFDEAVKSYDQALTINNDDYDAWLCRGEALAEQGRHEEALQSFNPAILIDPTKTRWGGMVTELRCTTWEEGGRPHYPSLKS